RLDTGSARLRVGIGAVMTTREDYLMAQPWFWRSRCRAISPENFGQTAISTTRSPRSAVKLDGTPGRKHERRSIASLPIEGLRGEAIETAWFTLGFLKEDRPGARGYPTPVAYFLGDGTRHRQNVLHYLGESARSTNRPVNNSQCFPRDNETVSIALD